MPRAALADELPQVAIGGADHARSHPPIRADLLFRLDVFHLVVPALRERIDDVPLLARTLLERLADRLQLPIPVLSDAFYESLSQHHWPGNVRELENTLERFLVRHQAGLVDSDAARPDGWERAETFPVSEGLSFEMPAAGERARIACQLRAAGGNVSRASRRLGIARSTLRYKIRLHGLESLIPRD